MKWRIGLSRTVKLIVSRKTSYSQLTDSMFSLSTFEHQLVMYVTADDKATFATAFDMSSVPVVSHEQALAEERTKKLTSATPTLKAPSTGPKKQQANGTADKASAAVAAAQKHAQALLQIPELKAHGPLLSSSQSVELTESETEYVVTAIKHIYKDHIVIQYDLKNTLAHTVLEDISITATPSEDDASLEEEFIVPVAKLGTDELGTVFVSFRKVAESAYPVTSFTNVLKFTSKEIDPSSGETDETGYEDEYQVEDLELVGSDYVQPAFAGSFDHVWETTGANGEEAEETLQLSAAGSIAGMSFSLSRPNYSSGLAPRLVSSRHLRRTIIKANQPVGIDATESLTKTLSLQPLDGTDVALSTSTHTLKLYGKTLGGGKVASLIKLAFSARSGVTMKITVRSEEEGVAALVVGSVS